MVRTQPADAKVSLEVGKSTYPIHPQYPEAGSWKLEAGSWKLEAGSWKQWNFQDNHLLSVGYHDPGWMRMESSGTTVLPEASRLHPARLLISMHASNVSRLPGRLP